MMQWKVALSGVGMRWTPEHSSAETESATLKLSSTGSRDSRWS